MNLGNNYRLSNDERNVILERLRLSTEKTKKVGDTHVPTGEWTRETWEVQGYYPTLQAALRGYVNQELRAIPEGVFEVMAKIEEVMEVIENIKGGTKN